MKNKTQAHNKLRARKHTQTLVTIALISLSAVVALAGWKMERTVTKSVNNPIPIIAAPVPSPTVLPLAKEYIYAGERLIATEVPNAAPTVSISSPANNSVFAAPASITIDATAADSDGSISKVEFYQGTTLLNTDTAAPFSFNWTNVAAGGYSLTAKATDNNDAVTTSSAISVKSNAAPTVSLSSPANNSVFTAPASITINATAADSDGSISKVEFYQGTTLLNTDTAAPFSFNWTNVAAGTYSLTAKATDNDNAVTTSSAISVKSNAEPTVSISSPANNSVFAAPASITINATAADSDGSISKVEFYQGTTLLNTDTAAPFSFNWTNVAAGTYSLTAKATDNNNAVTTSSAISVKSNAAPTVSISSPANNSVFAAPASITIDATAADSDGSISKVEFYQGTTLLNTDTAAPFSFNWTNVVAGTYSLTAKATDNDNAVTTSSAISVKSNAAPTVTITSPTNNATFTAPANITINASANDADGTISKVEFYQGDTLLNTDTMAPFSFAWNNVAASSYSLTAKATDNNNAVTTSSAIAINVGPNAAPTVSISSPANNSVFTAPASITINATAADSDGSISKVEFYQGTTLLNTDTAAPFSFNWTNVAASTYSLTAKATDNNNAVTTSSAISVKSNAAPTVSITSPANNATFTAPASITINASASDADGTISKVEFYQGTTLLGTDTAAPFTFSWANVAPGTYSLTAKATDNNSAVTTSSAVSVISNAAPTVNITSPANNAMFAAPANITIDASASDADGTISSVEFYQGTTLLGTDTTAPFSFTWNNVASGSYLLTARATDNRGATTTSVALTLTTPSFYDDFNDNSLDLTKWHIRETASPAVVSEQAQQLRITLPASTATYNGIGSNATYDMRGGTAQVELVQSVSQAGWVENFLILEADTQNYFMIQTGAGNLLLRAKVNGSNDQLIIPYDSAAHRYWRIRHNLNTNSVYFETSPEGVTWTARKTVTAGFAVTAIRFSLWAGAYGTGNAAPGAAVYNDFQFIPDPSLPGTPAPFLSDDFNDNSLDTTKWNPDNLFSGYTNPGVPISETAQRLEIGPLLQTVNGSSYRGLRSVNAYSFTGAYSYVELVQAPSATTAADAMFTVGKDVNYYYRIYVSAGNLFGQRKVDGIKTALFTIPYDPVNHRFLRIRHDSVTGSVTLDTAPSDGGTPGPWVQRYSETWNPLVSLGAIIFEVKGGTSQIEANPPGKVIFDNFRAAINGS